MAIKIDLLPGYVGLKRTFKLLLNGAIVLITCVGVILFLVHNKGERQLAALDESINNLSKNASDADQAKSQADKATADTALIEPVVKFVVAANKTGTERAALLDMVSRSVYGGAVVNGINISNGASVVIDATVNTPEDFTIFLLEMRKHSVNHGGQLYANDARTDSVVPEGLWSFPDGPRPSQIQPGFTRNIRQFPLPVKTTGTLLNPVVIPAEPVGTAAAPATPPNPAAPAQ